MINIKEQKAKKVVGDTSLLITFDFNIDIVNIIKSMSGSNYSKKDKTWEVPCYYLAQLLDDLCVYDDINLELLQYKEQTTENKIFKLKKYKLKPFKYQEEGIQYGLNHPRWLLLDEAGLGKSSVLIHIAEELKKMGKIKHCLVICGLNTLKENWVKEINKHSDLTCHILGQYITKTGRKRIGQIKDRVAELKSSIKDFFLITNIETLRSDDIIKTLQKGPNKFDMVIFDECHVAKNPNTAQGSNMLKLTNAPYKIAATGTLLLNNPLDAYLPLKWIGAENAVYTNFKNFYCVYNGLMMTGFKHLDVIKEQIEKNSLRRLKSEVLDLPPKMIIDEYVEMEDAQATLYENVKAGIKSSVDKVKLNTTNLLALVGRLRQATACPSILTTEKIPSSKADRACDLARQIISNGEKVVIFSTFKETAKELCQRLSEFKPLLCTGDVKDDVISHNIDDFQNKPDNKCFIATWQKCGTGITLTAASYVIFIDTPWTEAVFSQACDRCYRFGTTKPVTIYNLITKDTIDERVLEILNTKQAISDYVIDDKVSDKTIESLKKYILDL